MIDIRIVLDHAGNRQDLQLIVDEDAGAESFYDLVAKRIGQSADSFSLRHIDSRRKLPKTGDIRSLGLLHGDHLSVEYRSVAEPASTESGVEVRVIEGPHAGEMFFNGDLPFDIGRRKDAGVALVDDDQCSRRHATVSASPAGLMLSDLGSTNGSWIDGERINGSQLLKAGEVVSVGNTQLTMTWRRSIEDLAHLRYTAGHLSLNRAARMHRRRPNSLIALPNPPESPSKRRLPKAAIAGPALMGVPMYFVTKNPLTLVLILGSPLLAIFSWLDDRSSGRKDFKTKAAEYRNTVQQLASEADDACAKSLQWRIDRNPGPDEVMRRAVSRDPSLWQRDSADSDFLELRVGTLDQPSLVSVRTPDTGDPELLDLVKTTVTTNRRDPDAPLVIPIGKVPESEQGKDAMRDSAGLVDVITLVGEGEETGGLARWLLAQLVVHHSPQEVAVALLMPASVTDWAWARWLPHLEQLSSDDDNDAAMIATDDNDASNMFKALRAYAQNRIEAGKESFGGGIRYRPHVVVMAELPLRAPESEFTSFLEQLPQANMSVILLARDRRMVPRATDVIVAFNEGGLNVEFVRADIELKAAVADHLAVDEAARLARSLAPIRDVSISAGGGTHLPGRVNLLEMLQLTPLTVEDVLSRWQSPPDGLRAPLGIDAGGVMSVELAPHGLVCGTTGAGKSELLQTYVASLALTYPPERLNFVFVDFKGGLAFNNCVDLPHAVGLITNLDAHLAERVMKSLQAELDERTRIINSLGGGDLASLAKREPLRAPPALLIVFDEFREAVEKVPTQPGEKSFISHVMSLARLGRQVGIHVVLATQTPGAETVTEDLKNNIDLRVSLRVKTTEVSRNIIGKPDAALITKRTPGRAYAQLEEGDVREFQAAFVGGVSAAPDEDAFEASLQTVNLGKFTTKQLSAKKAAFRNSGMLDLQVIVDTVKQAAAKRGTAGQRSPWLPELPPVLPLRRVLEETASQPARGLTLPIGRSDDPARQRQDWHWIDLERAGSMLVFGGAGSGKTTLLRSLAAAGAARFSPEELNIYGLDFTGQSLNALSALPHCAATVTGRETDRVRQLVTVLKLTVEQRLAMVEQAGVGSIAELNARGEGQQANLLLFIDGFFQLWEQYKELSAADPLYDDILDLIGNGRAAGLYCVLTASRSGLPPNVTTAIPMKLVMRMNTKDEYGSLGLKELAHLETFPSGRAFTATGVELQVSVLSPPDLNPDALTVSVGEQLIVLESLGERLQSGWGDITAPKLRSLPKHFSLSTLPRPASTARSFAIAVDELNIDRVDADFGRAPTFLVVGPEQSGKTTTVTAIATQFRRAWPVAPLHHIVGRRSAATAGEALWTSIHTGAEVVPFMKELSALIKQRATQGADQPMMLVLDDAEPFNDGEVRDLLDADHLAWRDANLFVVAAMTTFAASKSYAKWLKLIEAGSQGLLLMPNLALDGGAIFDRRLPARARLELPPGRGFLLQRTGYTLVQVAVPD